MPWTLQSSVDGLTLHVSYSDLFGPHVATIGVFVQHTVSTSCAISGTVVTNDVSR